MEYAQKLKISQCLFFGLLFQYSGWLMKGLDVDEKSIILGGKITFALSFVLLIWGGVLAARAKGLVEKKGIWQALGLVILAVGAWTLFNALVMKAGEPIWLHKRFTGLLLLIVAEGWILHWLHGGKKVDDHPAPARESDATAASTPT